MVNTKRIIDLLEIQENSNFRFIWYSLSIWNFFLTDTTVNVSYETETKNKKYDMREHFLI